jgi:hypothetical protein
MSMRCPTPWKRAHANQAAAQAHAGGLHAKAGNAAFAQHPYRCPSGGHWHVGGLAKAKGRRR